VLTVKDIAIKLNASEQHIRGLIRSNILTGTRIGRQWVVQPKDFSRFLKNSNFQEAPIDHPRKTTRIPKIKALSFFSGAMGLDLGLEKAGIKVILACEFDKACRKTIEANRPELALLGDIWDYSADDILKAAGLEKKDDVELIVGGPPCQSFSTAGARRGFKDDRGNALLKYISLILEIRPRYAVIENVRGLLSAPLSHRPHSERTKGKLSIEELPGGALMHVLKILRKDGYSVSFNLYNAANFGSPQTRERVVIICHREGEKVPYLVPTHSQEGQFQLPKWRTFKDAVSGLENIDHHHVNFPEERLHYYRMLQPGQYWKHLPEEIQKKAMGKSYYSGGGKTGFLRRLAWNKPSPTLVTHPAMPATDLAHPTENRPLSVEEYKRLQEFPDDWIVCGKLSDQYKQIGNAVPVSLGEAIGKAILNHMKGKKENSFSDFSYSRYKNTDDLSWELNIKSLLNE
jgi:DNA (cytosine-5)-methyltransferase 1